MQRVELFLASCMYGLVMMKTTAQMNRSPHFLTEVPPLSSPSLLTDFPDELGIVGTWNDFPVTDRTIQILGDNFMRHYQLALLNDVALEGRIASVLRAKTMEVTLNVEEVEQHEFLGISVPIEKIRRDNGTSVIFTLLMEFNFKSSLYHSSGPFFQVVSSQLVCDRFPLNADNAQECQVVGLFVPARNAVKSDSFNVLLDTDAHRIVSEKLHDDFEITGMEYQRITKRGESMIEYFRFEPTTKNSKTPRNCLGVLLHDENGTQLKYMDTSCYAHGLAILSKQSMSESSETSGVYSVAAIVFFVMTLITLYVAYRREKAKYQKVAYPDIPEKVVQRVNPQYVQAEIEKAYLSC